MRILFRISLIIFAVGTALAAIFGFGLAVNGNDLERVVGLYTLAFAVGSVLLLTFLFLVEDHLFNIRRGTD